MKSSTRDISKRPGHLTMLLHTCLLCMTVALNWFITLHYVTGLAPSDYFLFPNMKEHFAGKQYRTDDDVISAVDDFFQDQDKSFYTTGIQALQN